MPNGFIFLCNNATQRECFEKKLFGAKFNRKDEVAKIKQGDIGFLYNYEIGSLYGVFQAVSNGGMNLEPQAWKGMYLAQVRVDWKKEYKRTLDKSLLRLIDFIIFRGPFVINVLLTPEQVSEMLAFFEAEPPVKSVIGDEDFRQKYPTNYRADDGHMVRTKGEMLIDNWLFKQKLAHAYERKARSNLPANCDGNSIFTQIRHLKEQRYQMMHHLIYLMKDHLPRFSYMNSLIFDFHFIVDF